MEYNMEIVDYSTYTVDMMRDFAKTAGKFDEIGETLDAILVAAKMVEYLLDFLTSD